MDEWGIGGMQRIHNRMKQRQINSWKEEKEKEKEKEREREREEYEYFVR